MATPEVNGPGKAESLWTRPEAKRRPVEEQPETQGMTASFGPGGMNFADTIKSTFSSSGNNCAGW